MKMKNAQQTLCAALLAALAAGCSDYDNGFTEKEIEYQETFSQTFGDIADDQDWNAATAVTASVDLTGIADGGAATVLIFNANPAAGGELAACLKVDGTKTATIDLPKTALRAWVDVVDQKGRTVMSRYCDVAGGQLRVSAESTRSAADPSCSATVGREVKLSDEYTFAKNGGNDWSSRFGFSVYYLDGVSSAKADPWTVKDLAAIVGEGGTYPRWQADGSSYSVTFPEGYFAEHRDNRELYKDRFQKGITYTKEEAGPVSISYIFGGTANTNQLGYYYYKPGATPEQTLQNKIAARKYVLVQNAEPQNNITVDGKTLASGMALPEQFITGYYYGRTPSGFDHALTGDELVQGTQYSLVYFGDDYDEAKATHTFPKGYRIGFFIRSLANYCPLAASDYATAETQGWNIVYSEQDINRYYGKLYDDSTGDWKAVTASLSHTAVTESANVRRTVTSSVVVAGFEDGQGRVDNDLNDILFLVDGVSVEESFEEPVSGQTWVIGCEDLGGIGDFDFNDIVFAISHVSGEDKAYLTPLAAGGTLPTYLYLKGGEQKLTETEYHALWGDSHPHNIIINGYETGTPGKTLTFSVDENYTISYQRGGTNMGGIEIHVVQNGTEETGVVNIVRAPDVGKAPQMVLIHQSTWAWPLEGVNVFDVYPDFATFAATGEPLEWYNRVNYSRTAAKASTISNSNTGTTVNTGEKTPEKITPSITLTPNSLTLDPGSEATVRITTSGELSKLHSSVSNDLVTIESYNQQTGTLTLRAGQTAGTAKLTVLHEATSTHNQNYTQLDITVNEPAAQPEPEPEPEPVVSEGNIPADKIQKVRRDAYVIDKSVFAAYTNGCTLTLHVASMSRDNGLKLHASHAYDNPMWIESFDPQPQWLDAKGNKLSAAPKAAGTYQAVLTPQQVSKVLASNIAGLLVSQYEVQTDLTIDAFSVSGQPTQQEEEPTQAAGGTTYTGASLEAIHSGSYYNIPAAACKATSSLTVTLTCQASDIWYFSFYAWASPTQSLADGQDVFPNVGRYTMWGISFSPGQSKEFTFTATTEGLRHISQDGITIWPNNGTITQIRVEAK